jgi:hypothetical protein
MNFWLFEDAARRFFQQKSAYRSSVSAPKDSDPAIASYKQQPEIKQANSRIHDPAARVTRDLRWTSF